VQLGLGDKHPGQQQVQVRHGGDLVVGLDHVARLHQPLADHAGDGRNDLGVLKLDLGGGVTLPRHLQVELCVLQSKLGVVIVQFGLLVFLGADQLLPEEFFVALVIAGGLLLAHFGLRQGDLGLVDGQGVLVIRVADLPVVQLDEHLAGGDVVAFLEVDAGGDAGGFGEDVDAADGVQRGGGHDEGGHVAAVGQLRLDRHGGAGTAGPLAAGPVGTAVLAVGGRGAAPGGEQDQSGQTDNRNVTKRVFHDVKTRLWNANCFLRRSVWKVATPDRINPDCVSGVTCGKNKMREVRPQVLKIRRHPSAAVEAQRAPAKLSGD